MGVELRMLGTAQVSCLLLVAATAQGQAALEQGAEAPEFRCPESNGKFRDSEQCDLFYICRNDVATIEFCPEGLLFDDKVPNHEKCVLPHNVDCGDRIYVQEPSPDRDPKCERANGVFNHPDENTCDKYIQCDNGNAFELPCPIPLVFDVLVGSCVRKGRPARRPEGVMENKSLKLMDSNVPEVKHSDHKICFKLTPSTPILQTVAHTSLATTIRSLTNLAAAKEMFSMLTLKPAKLQRKFLSAPVGTSALRTANVLATAMLTVVVQHSKLDLLNIFPSILFV